MDAQGLIRIGGHLGDRIESPHPIVLPREREIVGKLIAKIHSDNGHTGAATIHHLSRRQYWILQGGAAARSAVVNCIQCKCRFKPASTQQMAQHPRTRCVVSFPFEVTGVDLASPYWR